MALTSVTITYNIADLIGVDFDPRRTKVWVTTNVPNSTIVDPDGGQVRIGDGIGTLGVDGTGSVTVWRTSPDSQPASWYTYFHVDYAERRPGGKRRQNAYGPFIISSSTTLANLIATQEPVPTPGVEYGVIQAKPALFPGLQTRTVTVRKVGPSRFVSDYNIDADRPPTGVTYYAAPNASYGAAGTLAAPCSFRGAHDKSDVGTIRLVPGTGGAKELWQPEIDGLITKPLNIIADPADQMLYTGHIKPSDLTWTSEAGSIYKTTITGNGAQWVIDKRPAFATLWNTAATYTKVNDLASITGPGQWAYVGTTLYVWALSGSNLVTDSSFLRVSRPGFTGVIVNGAHRVYMEGFEIQGCGWASQNVNAVDSRNNGRGTFLARNMRYRHNVLTGFRPGDFVWSAAIDCEASDNGGDAFGYQSTGGRLCEFIEVNCYGHHNTPQDPANVTINGSTAHDSCVGVRFNTRAISNYGPGIVDVGGAKSWNLGCEARNSTSPTNDDGFQCYGTSATEAVYGRMWLDACDASGNGVGVRAGGFSTVYIANEGPGGNQSAERLSAAGGVFVDY